MQMKKLIVITLTCLLLLGLCACGGGSSETTADTTPETTTVPPETGAQTTAPTQETTVPETTGDIVELVRSYIDRPIEELYAVIGEPEYSDYAPSCLGSGEDGMLYYEGFIVYTYREGDVETVCDVE